MPRKKRGPGRRRRGHYHRGEYTSTKTGLVCKHRSGWELVYMTYLDAELSVTTWGYESVVIPYVSNVRTGRLRNYHPDFVVTYVDGRRELVEIKPSKRVKQAAVQKKLKAAGSWCAINGVELKVVTEVELKALGLV